MSGTPCLCVKYSILSSTLAAGWCHFLNAFLVFGSSQCRVVVLCTRKHVLKFTWALLQSHVHQRCQFYENSKVLVVEIIIIILLLFMVCRGAYDVPEKSLLLLENGCPRRILQWFLFAKDSS